MKLKNWLPLIGLVLFAIILYKVGFSNVYHSLISIKIQYLPIILLIAIFDAILVSYKWNLFLKYQKVSLKLIDAFKINLTSYFYGVITPMRVGYFYKIKLLKDKANISIGESLPSIIFDRLADFFWLFLLAIISTVYLIHVKLNFFSKFYIYFEFGALFLLIFSIWFFFNKKRSRIIMKWVYNYLIPNKYKPTAKEVFEHFYLNMPHKKKLIYPVSLALVSYYIFFSQIFLIAVALGIKMNYSVFLVVYPLIMFFTLFPISLGGLGTRDAASIVLLGLFGVSAGQSVALSLLTFIFVDFLLGGIGFVFSLKKNDSINNNSVS